MFFHVYLGYACTVVRECRGPYQFCCFSKNNSWLPGKTTTATLVARESGRDVLELNASDARSKKALSEALGDVTGSQVLSFENMGKKDGKNGNDSAPVQRRCIIMDEVDGMGAGDRSGMSELIQMIKKSKVPIVSRDVSVYRLFPPLLPLANTSPRRPFVSRTCTQREDLHLQRPIIPQNEVARPILHGSQVFPSDEISHCTSCRRNLPSRGNACRNQRRRGLGRELWQ